jgi:hypothetical protein
VSTIFLWPAYGAAIVLGFPWLMTLPLLISVALFRADRLLEFVAEPYVALLSDLRIVLVVCAWLGLGLVLGICAYWRERRV